MFESTWRVGVVASFLGICLDILLADTKWCILCPPLSVDFFCMWRLRNQSEQLELYDQIHIVFFNLDVGLWTWLKWRCPWLEHFAMTTYALPHQSQSNSEFVTPNIYKIQKCNGRVTILASSKRSQCRTVGKSDAAPMKRLDEKYSGGTPKCASQNCRFMLPKQILVLPSNEHRNPDLARNDRVLLFLMKPFHNRGNSWLVRWTRKRSTKHIGILHCRHRGPSNFSLSWAETGVIHCATLVLRQLRHLPLRAILVFRGSWLAQLAVPLLRLLTERQARRRTARERVREAYVEEGVRSKRCVYKYTRAPVAFARMLQNDTSIRAARTIEKLLLRMSQYETRGHCQSSCSPATRRIYTSTLSFPSHGLAQMHFPPWPRTKAPHNAQQTRLNHVNVNHVGAAKSPVLKPRCLPRYICSTKWPVLRPHLLETASRHIRTRGQFNPPSVFADSCTLRRPFSTTAT